MFRGGERDDATAGGTLRLRAGVSCPSESDVVVVRLVPESLRMRRLPLGTRVMLPFDNREDDEAAWLLHS